MNLNKIILAGRLTTEPELKQTSGGQNVTTFSIATNRIWTDKKGEKQEVAEFHNIVVWGKLAELSSQYLQKGQVALIEGRLQTRIWDDRQGNKRHTTEIMAENIQFGDRLDKRKTEENFSNFE